MDIILPGGWKIAANRSSLGINGAVYLFANESHEGDTPRPGAVTPLHDEPEVIKLVSHFYWYSIRPHQIGFSPVKGGPVVSTTGAAFKARIDLHFSIPQIMCFSFF